jgi:GMP synthase (glutamine-hydrolysing)
VGSILVLKMGSTLPALKARKGDFEDWIISGLGLPRERAAVVNVPAGEPLPSPDDPAGIVVTGSHTMVTECREWSEEAGHWLRDAVNARVPVLGICYGHQLLAHALGGEVADNPKGREFGTVDVVLSENAGDDPLLAGLPRRIRVHVGHTQSVLRLPEGAVRLASNPWDANQAARFGPAAWGVQFHPEFDAEIIREYLEHYRGVLSAEGQDPDRLLSSVVDEPAGRQVLRKFAALVTREA